MKESFQNKYPNQEKKALKSEIKQLLLPCNLL